MTSIVVIEDQAIFREGLNCLIAEEPNLKVVGQAADGKTGIDLVETLSPALVLLDPVPSASPSGFEVLGHLRSTAKLIALSARTDEPFVIETFLHGADGYAAKSDSFAELRKAIAAVLEGRRYISPRLDARRLARTLQRQRIDAKSPRKRLTARQHEVLSLAAEGYTSGETAARLSISSRTVEMHRANLMRNLGLRGTADLVRFAIRNRMIAA